jgi:hypothetical protein
LLESVLLDSFDAIHSLFIFSFILAGSEVGIYEGDAGAVDREASDECSFVAEF